MDGSGFMERSDCIFSDGEGCRHAVAKANYVELCAKCPYHTISKPKEANGAPAPL
jgi:hypothetical protein